MFFDNTYNLIPLLKSFEPVKYNIANAYSYGSLTKKSILLNLLFEFNLVIAIIFFSPFVNNSFIISFFFNLFIKLCNKFSFSNFIITSISPDSDFFLLYEPTISILFSVLFKLFSINKLLNSSYIISLYLSISSLGILFCKSS